MGEGKVAWRFRCYRSERGEDQIDRWVKKTLSRKALAKLERALEYLCVRPPTEWGRPHASPLGDHIYVIRFSDENRAQYRIAGHFHSDGRTFVLTQPVQEKDGKYDPNNYEQLASDHKDVCDSKFDTRTETCFELDIHRDEDSQRAEGVHKNSEGWLH